MDITALRALYPQYNDLSDRDLLLGFHKKFYSDMPVADFFKNVGYDTRAIAEKQIAGDPITRGAQENTSLIPSSMRPALKYVGQNGMVGGPMGIATDAAVRGTGELMDRAAYKGGELVTDAASRLGAPAEVAGGLGYATNIGIQAFPMELGGKLGKAATPAMRALGERLMQSALKPNAKSMLKGQGDRAIKTLLDEGGGMVPGYNVTPGGMARLQGDVGSLNDEVAGILRSTQGTVDKGAAGARIQDAIAKTERFNPTPQDATAQMERVANQFHSNPLVPSQIPLPRAQELKQGIYKTIDDSYGELSGATTEAQKALARGLKEELERAAPSIGPINAKNAELINALKQVKYRSAVAGNKNPMGLALLPHSPMAAAAFIGDRSELIKSLLARGINAGKTQIPATAGRAAGAAYGSYSGQPE